MNARLRKYLTHTRRPLVSLVFAAPLLALYELGVWTFPETARNGADVWMRGWLDQAGLSGTLVLPAVTIGVLLAWHHVSRDPWRLPRGVLVGMTIESCALGVLLLLVAYMLAPALAMLTAIGDKQRLWLAAPAFNRLLARMVEFVGAGVYEEVLFRLLLLPALIAVFALAMPRRGAAAAAVVASSLLFAAAHHVGAQGDAWALGVFAFRACAGVFFALLFLYRGFGVAIGAHAVYDISVAAHTW